jgi:hypothetical protein
MSLLYCATSFRASSLMSRNIIFFPSVSLFLSLIFPEKIPDPCLSNPRLFFALVFLRFPPNQTTEKELGAIVAKDFSVAILFVT